MEDLQTSMAINGFIHRTLFAAPNSFQSLDFEFIIIFFESIQSHRQQMTYLERGANQKLF